MDEEAVVARLPLVVAVRERLERALAAIARLADGCEEERLLDPGAGGGDQVDAGDEDGVVGGRAGGQLGRAREQVGGAVLDRAEQPAVVVDEFTPKP